jgi:hypothetical protein
MVAHRLYYMHDPSRLSTCPVTIHALLHIADGIEACGPVWAYWAFPMERYCGFLGRCIKSRRFPFANLDSYCLSLAQLTQVRNRWNLHEQLTFKPKRTRGHLRSETHLDGECKFGLYPCPHTSWYSPSLRPGLCPCQPKIQQHPSHPRNARKNSWRSGHKV